MNPLNLPLIGSIRHRSPAGHPILKSERDREHFEPASPNSSRTVAQVNVPAKIEAKCLTTTENMATMQRQSGLKTLPVLNKPT